jgi:REP element-mobilizing transposase RayT
MANTYTSLHYHFTFSTKNREPWIVPTIETRLGHISAALADNITALHFKSGE